jgi:uncharacterized protein (DUF1778 family)
MTTVIKAERIALRVTAAQKRNVEAAAHALGRTLTEFTVEAVTERAEEVLAEQRIFDVPADVHEAFLAALDAPTRPAPALIDLVRRPTVFDA